jgi:hypothetical protein
MILKLTLAKDILWGELAQKKWELLSQNIYSREAPQYSP